jgi:phosphoenolpyruvate---glycerone phosphotransferase subunit DhaL
VSVDGAQIVAWMQDFAASVADHKQELVKLDTAIGDSDHGTNMDRGMQKAVEQLTATAPADAASALKTVAMALISTVGGAAGPLYGTLFLQMSSALNGVDDVDLAAFTTALEKGVEGVQARGKAQPNDKTMIDALLPAVTSLKQAVGQGTSLGNALNDAAEAAREGMLATTPLVARKGRASYLGERSAGHQDPGATSSYYLIKSAAETLTD